MEAQAGADRSNISRAARAAMGVALGTSASGLGQQAAAQTADTQLAPVTAEGTAARPTGLYQTTMPSLDKLTQPLLDTPQSISVIPRALMDDKGVTTLRDALRDVPGVSLAAGEGGQQGDNLSIRGFNAQNDFFLDGMRDFGSYYRDPFNLDSVEVLKGPASVLFGRGSTGGVINQVSKQAQLQSITGATLAFGTDGTKRSTFDIDRALPGLDGAAIRLNAMIDEGGVAGRNTAENRRFGLAPELVFGLGTDTRVRFNYFHQQEYDTPDYGIPWLNGKPAPVNRSNFYGFSESDHFRTNVDIGTARVEHDFGDAITITSQTRYGSYSRDLRVTEPLITGYTPSQDIVPLSVPIGALNVSQHVIALSSRETLLDHQDEATFRFETGPVSHIVVAGIEVARQTSDPTRYLIAQPKVNLLVPASSAAINLPAPISSIAGLVANNYAAYVIDTIKLGEHWEVIGGWRFDRYDSTYPPICRGAEGQRHPGRRQGHLARGARLQAGHQCQPLCRLWYILRSLGRGAELVREHRRRSAGKIPQLRDWRQMGYAGQPVVADHGVLRPGKDRCPGNQSGRSHHVDPGGGLPRAGDGTGRHRAHHARLAGLRRV